MREQQQCEAGSNEGAVGVDRGVGVRWAHGLLRHCTPTYYGERSPLPYFLPCPKSSHIVFDTINDTFQLIHETFNFAMMSKIYLDGILKMWYIFDRRVSSSIYSPHQFEPRTADFSWQATFLQFKSSCLPAYPTFSQAATFLQLKVAAACISNGWQ